MDEGPVILKSGGRLFMWDAARETGNRKSHDVSFSRAALVFADDLRLEGPCPTEDAPAARRTIGMATDLVFSVVFMRSEEGVELLSARLATREERRAYEAQAF